jgi:type II secretory pathway component PulM
MSTHDEKRTMASALARSWASRSRQERRGIAVLAGCVGIVLYAWLLQSTVHTRQRLMPAVAQLQAQAIRLDDDADEIMRLRAAPPPAQASTDLRQLVQRQVDAGGLARSLVSIEAVGTHQVKVVFGTVPFAHWLSWVDTLQSQHVRLDAVRIETQPGHGLVSVTATLDRAAP